MSQSNQIHCVIISYKELDSGNILETIVCKESIYLLDGIFDKSVIYYKNLQIQYYIKVKLKQNANNKGISANEPLGQS